MLEAGADQNAVGRSAGSTALVAADLHGLVEDHGSGAIASLIKQTPLLLLLPPQRHHLFCILIFYNM